MFVMQVLFLTKDLDIKQPVYFILFRFVVQEAFFLNFYQYYYKFI